jgi:hypothetical protein
MAKRRRVPKDKKTGLPKNYLSGVKGSRRQSLASITKRIKKLAAAGKFIPVSLMNRRIKLGKKKK